MYNSGIYKITNINNSKCYIGSAIDINRRWSKHKATLKHNTHTNKYLQLAYNKEGKPSIFIYEVLLYCDVKDLLFYEQRAINTYKPEYNICQIAASQLGMKHSEETKKKISSSLKGRTISEEARKKVAISAMGNKRNLGRSPSKETRQKMSESAKGRIVSEETRAKLRIANAGRVISDETRLKLSLARRRLNEKK